jgi:hypothetical protein
MEDGTNCAYVTLGFTQMEIKRMGCIKIETESFRNCVYFYAIASFYTEVLVYSVENLTGVGDIMVTFVFAFYEHIFSTCLTDMTYFFT